MGQVESVVLEVEDDLPEAKIISYDSNSQSVQWNHHAGERPYSDSFRPVFQTTQHDDNPLLISPTLLTVSFQLKHPICDYDFKKKLYEGGWSTVYKAVAHHDDHKRVAVKEINLQFMKNRHREAIQREMNILSQLKHPHIVELFAVYALPQTNKIFLVTEYLRGGDLLTAISQSTEFYERDALAIFYQIALALQYIHQHHVIHRDIKPLNILFTTNNHTASNISSPVDASVSLFTHNCVKIVDFGFAMIDPFAANASTNRHNHSNATNHVNPAGSPRLSTSMPSSVNSSPRLSPKQVATSIQQQQQHTHSHNNHSSYSTGNNSSNNSRHHPRPLPHQQQRPHQQQQQPPPPQPMLLCGTPGYIAPELYLPQRQYSRQIDVWSLGCVLYLLLSGTMPFATDKKGIRCVKEGHFTFPVERFRHVSALAMDLIRQMLVVDPAHRYTMDQVLQHPWMKLQEAVYHHHHQQHQQQHQHHPADTSANTTNSDNSPYGSISHSTNHSSTNSMENYDSNVLSGDLSENMVHLRDTLAVKKGGKSMIDQLWRGWKQWQEQSALTKQMQQEYLEHGLPPSEEHDDQEDDSHRDDPVDHEKDSHQNASFVSSLWLLHQQQQQQQHSRSSENSGHHHHHHPQIHHTMSNQDLSSFAAHPHSSSHHHPLSRSRSRSRSSSISSNRQKRHSSDSDNSDSNHSASNSTNNHHGTSSNHGHGELKQRAMPHQPLASTSPHSTTWSASFSFSKSHSNPHPH